MAKTIHGYMTVINVGASIGFFELPFCPRCNTRAFGIVAYHICITSSENFGILLAQTHSKCRSGEYILEAML